MGKFPATLMFCVNRFVNCAPKALIAWQPYRNYGRAKCINPLEIEHGKRVQGPCPETLGPHPDCQPMCTGALPRFDEIYYKCSDKMHKVYDQTWIEVPPCNFVPKRLPICDSEIPIKRRSRRERQISGQCPPAPETCPKTGKKLDCTKITMPGCQTVRKSLKCVVAKSSSSRRFCVPYPAFSECKKDKTKQKRKVECTCMANVSLCDVWKIMEKERRRKK